MGTIKQGSSATLADIEDYLMHAQNDLARRADGCVSRR